MPNYSNLFVCLMGVGTVFIGLICIIVLVSLMSLICRKAEKATPAAPVAAPAAQSTVEIADKGALIAAISAAIAEDMGEDISAIRITSIKKV